MVSWQVQSGIQDGDLTSYVDISVLVGVIGDRDDSGPNPGLALHTE